MNIRFSQLLLFILVGLLLFGNPAKRLKELGKGIKAFQNQLKDNNKNELTFLRRVAQW